MKYYSMHTGYTSQCYWAQEVDISTVPHEIFWNGMRGFHDKVRMEITKGGRLGDFIGNSATLRIASDRVIKLLENYNITGYTTYNVDVSGGKVELPKYYGLIAMGRGGHILPKESGVEFSSEIRPDGTRKIMGMKRLVFDENQWDGSDFFYMDEFPNGILVTERVKNLFKKEKVSNCELSPIEEYSF